MRPALPSPLLPRLQRGVVPRRVVEAQDPPAIKWRF
jgi:hypothetical protein